MRKALKTNDERESSLRGSGQERVRKALEGKGTEEVDKGGRIEDAG